MGNTLYLDFSKSTSTRVPVGSYPVKVTSIEEKEAKSGNMQILWHLEITEGEYAGKPLTLFTSKADNALWTVQNTMAALGVPANMLSGEQEFDMDQFVGQVAIAVCIENTWNGKTSVKVDHLDPIGG
jgi:hypothetical protein